MTDAPLARLGAALALLLTLTLPLAALAGCSARSTSSPRALSVSENPVVIRATGPWLGASGRAMGRVTVELENLEDREHSGSIVVTGDGYQTEILQAVPFELGPREKRRVDIRFTAFALGDGDVSLRLQTDGVRSSSYAQAAGLGHVRGAGVRVLVIENRRRPAGWEADRASMLQLAKRVPLAPGGAMVSLPFSSGPTSARRRSSFGGMAYLSPPAAVASGGSWTFAVGRIAPTELSPDADALQGYDAVVLDRSSEPPGPEAQAALEVFLRRGGNLVLAGGADARWSPDWLESYAPERFAFASRNLPEPTRRAGLGLLTLSEGEPLEDGDQLETLGSILEQVPSGLPAGTNVFGSIRPGRFPRTLLTTNLAADPRLMCFVVIAILVLLGPGVLLYVRKSGRPALLLVAVPAASLLTTVLVIAYGLVKDGVGLQLALRQEVVLDQRLQVASTREGRMYFAGPLVGSGLRPGAGTLVTAPPEPGSGSYGRRWRYRVDDTDGLRLSGDLFPKRLDRELSVVADRSTRARLEVDFSGASPRVANALGATVESLRLRDAAGQVWFAQGNIEPGATAELANPQRGTEPDYDLESLLPGSYTALLAAPLAFDDLGQSKFDLENCATEVYGILDLSEESAR